MIFSQLVRINDLNIWEGLTRVGCSQDVYADALRIFCRDLEKKCADLNEFVNDENWKEYASAVHAIKGGLAGIGAWRLAQQARDLDNAVQKKEYEFCRNKTEEVQKNLQQFADALRSGALFAEEKIEREKASSDFLEKKLNELYLYCSFGNSIEADALVKELRTKTYGGKTDIIVESICNHVENLDYHLVMQILAEQLHIKQTT